MPVGCVNTISLQTGQIRATTEFTHPTGHACQPHGPYRPRSNITQCEARPRVAPYANRLREPQTPHPAPKTHRPKVSLQHAESRRHHARASTRSLSELFYELNPHIAGPPGWWLDRQKLATNGPSVGLVRVEFEDGSATHYDPDDPADCRRVEAIRAETAGRLGQLQASAE